MILRDYHMHTTWCDGSASAENMVKAAIAQGLEEIGFSGHSYTWFDESYCMMPEATVAYRSELASLREKYAGRIRILIGTEQDRYSEAPTDAYDYFIGSVHYMKLGEEYVPVDETPEILRDAAKRYFDGDMMSLAEEYFRTAGEVAEKTGCSIIGHFDLITKFNEDGSLFDTEDPRYIAAWKAAADRLLKAGVPFEINTGAMSKGYRSEPYPAKPIRDYIRSGGGHFILSSDSHRTDTLCYAFDRYEDEADITAPPAR